MPEHPGFNLRQIDGRSIVQLRVRPSAADAAAKELELPQQALQCRGEDPAAYWLGPDQWLIASATKPAEDILGHVGHTLSGQLHAATDMSSHYVCFALKGPAARTVLAMGCGIDTHRDAFMTGHCVQTNFANVRLFIVVVDDDHFDLYVDRSHARYLSDWLVQSGEDPMTHDPKYDEHGESI